MCSLHGDDALREHRGRGAVVHRRRREIRDAGMPMLRVVRHEEIRTPLLGVREAVEAAGIHGRVLRGFEERFRVRIVIAHARARQRRRDPEIVVEGVQILRGLNATAITMRGELAPRNPVAATRGRDQPLRECHRLPRCQHPGDDIATVEVQHDVEFVPLAFGPTFQFRDIPRPHLIRCRRREARDGVRGMRPLRATLAHFLLRRQHAIHRARAAQIRPFIEQHCMHLCRGLIDEAVAVQLRQHGRLLRACQRAWRRPTPSHGRCAPWLLPAIRRRA